MQIISINDVTIFVTEIENESSSRRANERMAVSQLLGEAFPGTSLGHHLNGAPYIHERPDVHISVSHSRTHAALAVSPSPIGVDIEAPRTQLDNVASRFLSDAELATYSKSRDGLLRAWTAKEAVFKCAGYDHVDFASEIHLTTTTPAAATPTAIPAGATSAATPAGATVADTLAHTPNLTDIYIGAASLRDKIFTLHWHTINTQLICLAIPT